MSELTIIQRIDIERRIGQYMDTVDWSRINVGVCMMRFEDTHGEQAIRDLDAFVEWCETNNETDMIISTLAHDLNGCKDYRITPRTSGYSKYLPLPTE